MSMQGSEKIPGIKRRLVCQLLAGLVCVALAGIPSLGNADMAPIELKSGAASPIRNHSSVRMESELVIIRLGELSYSVDAVFHFFNTGQTTTEWVGFPKRGVGRFSRFDTSVDGRKIEVSEESDAGTKRGVADRIVSGLYRYIFNQETGPLSVSKDRWMVHHITFPGLATTTIRTSYEGHYAEGTADYILGTGSYWKERIGQVVFIIDCTDLGGTKNVSVDFRDLGVAPGPECLGDNLLKVEMNQVKPPPEAKLAVHVRR